MACPGPLGLETWAKCCTRSKNQKPTAAEKAEISISPTHQASVLQPIAGPNRKFPLVAISGNQLEPVVRGSFLKQP